MTLNPTNRSKSWENVNSAASERENEEIVQKKKITKTDSVGVQQFRGYDAIALASSNNIIAYPKPDNRMEASKQNDDWMHPETKGHQKSFTTKQNNVNKVGDSKINSLIPKNKPVNIGEERISSNIKLSHSTLLSKKDVFKERHQRLFIFSPDMYEKLLEHRETIERRIAVINKQTRQHGNDGELREDGSISDAVCDYGAREDSGGLDHLRRLGEGVSLCFDNSRHSVLIDADEEEKISKAKRELCQLFPTIPLSSTSETTDILPSNLLSITGKNTDELGLSDLLPSLLLETDMNHELLVSSQDSGEFSALSSRPLTYAASWDVSTQSATMGANVDARRCHSSSGVISPHPSALSSSSSLSSNHRSIQNSSHLTDPVSLLLQSPLPPELCISSPVPSTKSSSMKPIYSATNSAKISENDVRGVPNFESQQTPWTQHTQLNRTLSDNDTKGLNDRRKLESEDSSYDSDHEYAHGHTTLKTTLSTTDIELSNVSSLNNWPLSTTVSGNDCGSNHTWRNNVLPAALVGHDEVSRSTSETLAAEFADYITLKPTSEYSPKSSLGPNPVSESIRSTKTDATIDNPVSGSSEIVQDEDYNSKLMFALKLGFNEELLKKALIKLGRNVGNDKILNELIRLQKLTSATDGLQQEKNSKKSVMNEDEISRKSNDRNLIGMGGRTSNDASEANDDMNGGRGRVKSSSGTNLSNNEDCLHHVVIDGSNVAMSHGNKDRFSCKGIAIAVEFFRKRGHKNISVFVPKWRKESSKPESPITDQHLLLELEKEGHLFFTPSRQTRGKRIVCHDDRYILNLAVETDGVVVSNDNYRELIMDKPEYRKIIDERILMYSFVNDRFMPPDDPLGRNGPTLDAFLRRKNSGSTSHGAVSLNKPTIAITPCPYGKKCTYGNKCKFYHAERGNRPQKSITDELKENSTQKINEFLARGVGGDKTAESSRDSSPGSELLRTKSMGRQFYPQSHDQLSQKTSLSEFEAIHKQQLSKTMSLNPRIDGSGSTLWPANIHPALEHQRMQGVKPQQSWNPMTAAPPIHSQPLPLDTSLPPPPPRTPWNLHDNIPSEQPKPMDGLLENNSHRKLARQLTLNPTYDPRIPRSHQQLNQNDVSVMNVPPPLPSDNPQQHHQAGFPYPPPHTGVPPPHYHKPSSNPSQHHMLLTRNASAPEPKHQHPQKMSLYGTQSTHGCGIDYDSYPQQGQGLHLQNQCQVPLQRAADNKMHKPQNASLQGVPKEFMTNPPMMQHQPMHKTVSDSFVWSSNTMEMGNRSIQKGELHQQPTGNVVDTYLTREGATNQSIASLHNTANNAISPLIGVSSLPGVWETNNIELRGSEEQDNMQRNLGPIGSKPATERSQESLDSERIRIYNHLTALFPKDQVIQAMTALPEERNPEQICKYIIFKNSSQ